MIKIFFTFLQILITTFLIATISNNVYADIPEITGSPEIDTPRLLDWELDISPSIPNLSEPTSNRIYDLHARISDCDDMTIVVSTSGNYHMAFRDLWYDHYLPRTEHLVHNWFYSTSPPVSVEQVQNKSLTFGNLRLECTPGIAVGPVDIMEALIDRGMIDGEPIPVIRNYGNVIIVKKGNPKNIRNIWDLGRPDIRVVTSNPDSEPGSFGNYRDSVFNIADSDPDKPYGWTAEKLFNRIFNENRSRFGQSRRYRKGHKYDDYYSHDDDDAHKHKYGRYTHKWLAGKRIHHREVPWSLAYGEADAGLLFYHIALYMVRRFPDLYEIVPLGGTVDSPEPVEGNKVATLYIAKILGDFNQDQIHAREELISAYLSLDFDYILEKHGLRRPVEFSRGELF